jgi:hypothetical protein
MEYEEFRKIALVSSTVPSEEIQFRRTPFDEIVAHMSKFDEQHWLGDVSLNFCKLLLSHPQCTVDIFKKYYHKAEKVFLISKEFFRKAAIFSNMSVIVVVLQADSDSPKDLENSWTFSSSKMDTVDNLLKNPHLNEDFKTVYGLYFFRVSGNDKYLPEYVKQLMYY